MWSLLQGNLFHNSDNMGLYCNEGYSVPTPLSTRIWWSLPCLWKLPRDQNALRPQGLVPWVNRLLSAYSDSIILRPCPPRLYGNDASPPDNFVSLRLQLHAQYDTSRVMFLHDIADIPTQFVRCFSETTKFKTTICSVVGMIVTWFYTRILVFPYCIYQFFIFFQKITKAKGSFSIFAFCLFCMYTGLV